ncbi:MAG: hypothetical protein M0P59_00305 [Gallionella sp.]|jgi:hypothetical protein|nr:hypothetical protein [Gallionella sp.]MCK9352581.1 hypothetical protein [Gallionella sp.]
MAKLIIRDGTSQDERLLPALKEGYVNVDEMRFEDMLAMVSEYAALVKHRDADSRAEGNWGEFFGADEAGILASILATNLNGAERDFSAFVADMETRLAQLRDGRTALAMLPTFRLAMAIDAWFVRLGRLSSVAAVRVRESMQGVIEKTLGTELQRLRVFLRQHHVHNADEAFRTFGPIWGGDGKPGKSGSAVPSPASGHSAVAEFLKSNFHAFYNALLFLQGGARDMLRVSLERSNHDPAIGLYIAFLRLFAKVQDKANGFTMRHLNFYYEDVLKIQRREFVPDSACLIVQPDTAGREVTIGKGTEFRAGLDENDAELIYAADNDLLVTDAKVSSLHTLYFGRNSLSSPENSLASSPGRGGRRKRFATSAKLNRMSRGGGESGAQLSHPLFGVPQRSKDASQFEEARIGFAVASNVLLLKHGQRDIGLTFKLAPGGKAGDPNVFADRLSRVLPTSKADAFFKAFRHMFRISLTGETGWFEVDDYLPLSRIVDGDGCEENSFKIQFRLPDSAGAVVPYSPAIHGENFDTELPVVRFTVNPDAYLYPYSLLSEMAVREILIEVDVRGCTDIRIYNQYGPLSADVQFNPFGATPSFGDYLVVGSYEAARKKLVAFEVDVEWSGLPQEMNGFGEYYRAYSMAIDNATFKAGLAVLRDRKWLPAEEGEQPIVELFESRDGAGTSGDGAGKNGSGKVGKRRRFSFRGVCKFMRPLENVAEEQYGYDSLSKDGFFKLALAQPSFAFGHKEYPSILTKVMTDNARLKKFGLAKWLSRSLPPKPLPNTPYTPLISGISVNYKAVSQISLERIGSTENELRQEKVFHLHPQGFESLSPRAYGKIHLVPRYETDGNLFIGLTATRLSGPLTLFFHLREDSLPDASARPFEFEWYYLASNQWRPLKKTQVVSDTTDGFLSSGIVTLDIPDDIDRANTILPSDQFWLRVSVDDEHMHTLCSLYAVHAQALRVSWAKREENSLSHLASALPAGSIKETKFSIPGLAGIRQIMESSGGKPPESDTQRTIRASERLRHKNRAVTPWDYERLVLQRFPEIYKAKCFSCMTGDAESRRKIKPGHLLIVLIPYLKEQVTANSHPMVNALLLREVRDFVKGLASACVKISVRNPAYERIQVRCKVKFRKGAGRGAQLNRLNREIVDYLSPWSDGGLAARFGWRLRCNDIQSHIQGLDYVESVSGLSMLRIDDGDDRCHHRLSDTARNKNGDIQPLHPWSIAIPVGHHLIEVEDEAGVCPPQKTGIANLAIGNTFILSRGNQ